MQKICHRGIHVTLYVNVTIHSHTDTHAHITSVVRRFYPFSLIRLCLKNVNTIEDEILRRHKLSGSVIMSNIFSHCHQVLEVEG